MVDPTPLEIITVVDYDPSWIEEFQQYAARLRTTLGDLILSVEHVGSTSVVGLAAKPIVDIDVIISSRMRLSEVIQRPATIGYVHEGHLGIRGREAFMWPLGKRHHLYVCSVDTPNLHNHLIFRDYLRTHPEAITAYAERKRQLAVQHADNMDAYGAAKSELILHILAEAEAEYGFHTFQPSTA